MFQEIDVTRQSEDYTDSFSTRISAGSQENSTEAQISEQVDLPSDIADHRDILPKKLVVASVDYDGCYSGGNYSSDQLKDGLVKDEVLRESNHKLLNHIVKASSHADQVQVLVGSTRQNSCLDAYSAKLNKNGSCFTPIKDIASHLSKIDSEAENKYKFNGFLLGDMFHGSPSGTVIQSHSNDIFINENNALHHSLPAMPSKIFLIYAQMHYMAESNPDAEIDFHFYDDRNDLLRELKNYYENHIDLIPKNIHLHLHQYSNNGEKPTKFFDVKGVGNIDKEYAKTLKENLKFDKKNDSPKLNFGTNDNMVDYGKHYLELPKVELDKPDYEYNIKTKNSAVYTAKCHQLQERLKEHQTAKPLSVGKCVGIVLGSMASGAALGAAISAGIAIKAYTALAPVLPLIALIPFIGPIIVAGGAPTIIALGTVVGAIGGAIAGSVIAQTLYKNSQPFREAANFEKSNVPPTGLSVA